MKKLIKIKNNKVYIGRKIFDIKDVGFIFEGNECYLGLMSCDFLVQQLRDYNNIPNKFSIRRRLNEKNTT